MPVMAVRLVSSATRRSVFWFPGDRRSEAFAAYKSTLIEVGGRGLTFKYV